MAGRPKLGLALSGGGFRASFFHLGVLRRLAELDLLRHVSVLSTVSGGSVVGALYMLHLAKHLKKSAKLRRDDYVALIGDVEKDFRAGTAANLRTRLFLDPVQNLRMWCTRFSMGRRMARLYHTHLYVKVARHIKDAWAKAVPLSEFRIAPEGKPLTVEIEAYNAGEADRLPKWVINATSLNTGGDFRFTPSEVGEPSLGSIRFDEVDTVMSYKRLLLGTWTRKGRARALNSLRDQELAGKTAYRERTSRSLAWWLAAQAGLAAERKRPGDAKAGEAAFKDLYAALKNEISREASWLDAALEGDWDASRRLATAEFGVLRRAKLAAWYLREGARKQPPVLGGLSAEQHVSSLWSAIEDVDAPLAERLKKAAPAQGGAGELAELLLDLFYFRSALAFSWTAGKAVKQLTVADAVAASANFPPVFSPFEILGLYDPGTVWRLALTDGGVKDNTGVDALLDEECTHVVASDAGRLLDADPRPGAGRLRSLMPRVLDVLMHTVRDQQLEALRERRRVTEAAAEASFAKGPRMTDVRTRYRLDSAVFFHLTSDPSDGAGDGPPPHPFADDLARLRTDLDAFHREEMDGLHYQGHQLADRFVRRWMGKAFTLDTSPGKLPALKLPAPEAVRTTRRVLRAGRRRFLRPFFALPLVARLALVLLLAGAAAAAAWFAALPLTGAGNWVLARLSDFARWPLLFGGRELWLEHPRSGWVVLGALVAFSALWRLWPRVEMALAGMLSGFGPRGVQLGAIQTARFLGLWRRNVWWLLGYAPLVLSLMASAWAAASYGLHRLARGK
jgi:predicted acylesterase/phospholipase RssA